jgi:hypothetical protein
VATDIPNAGEILTYWLVDLSPDVEVDLERAKVASQVPQEAAQKVSPALMASPSAAT